MMNDVWGNVAVPGQPGDTFTRGACATKPRGEHYCGARKIQTIRNQRGEIVGFGDCCTSSQDSIGSDHVYGQSESCAAVQCTANNTDCTYTKPADGAISLYQINLRPPGAAPIA